MTIILGWFLSDIFQCIYVVGNINGLAAAEPLGPVSLALQWYKEVIHRLALIILK